MSFQHDGTKKHWNYKKNREPPGKAYESQLERNVILQKVYSGETNDFHRQSLQKIATPLAINNFGEDLPSR